MNAETAYLVIAAGMAASLAAWWWSLQLLLQQRRWPAKFDGCWIIRDRTPQSALIESIGLTAPNCRIGRRGATGLVLYLGGCAARVEFLARERDVEMHAELDWARGRRMFGFFMVLLVLVVQPAVIIGIGGGLWHWVASSDSPETRALALQVLQIGHVLWPPFLVHLVYRSLRLQSRRVVEKLAELLAKVESRSATPLPAS